MRAGGCEAGRKEQGSHFFSVRKWDAAESIIAWRKEGLGRCLYIIRGSGYDFLINGREDKSSSKKSHP